MAIAVPDTLDEDVLTQQAEALDRKAEQLRAQARDLSQQAIDLRLAAERQGREPIRILQQRVGVERDARLLSKIPEVLDQIGPCASTAVAQHLNITGQRAYQALLVLEKTKVVKRSGIRRGTVWGLAGDEDLNGNEGRKSGRALVLEAARRLDTFDLKMISAELPMLTDEGIRRVLRMLVEDGAISEARDGKCKLYAWEKPEGGPTNRPKHEPPEQRVIAFARRGGLAVRGTGRRMRSGTPIVDELLRELNDWPIVRVVEHKHKYSFKIDDKEIAHCSKTPGASSLKDTRAHLRRAGIEVK